MCLLFTLHFGPEWYLITHLRFPNFLLCICSILNGKFVAITGLCGNPKRFDKNLILDVGNPLRNKRNINKICFYFVKNDKVVRHSFIPTVELARANNQPLKFVRIYQRIEGCWIRNSPIRINSNRHFFIIELRKGTENETNILFIDIFIVYCRYSWK